MKTTAFLWILMVALVISLCPVASAQVTRLSDSATFATLQAAHDDAGTATGETLLLTANLTETDITFAKPLTIDGQSYALDGGNASTGGWTLGTLAALTLKDLTIQNDNTGITRGIYFVGGSATMELNLDNVTVQNVSNYHMDLVGPGIVSITDSLITDVGCGIAMTGDNLEVTLNNTTIIDLGAGGYAVTIWTGNPYLLRLENGCVVETNLWSGIYDLGGTGTIILDDSHVRNQPNYGIWVQSAGVQLILQNGASVTGCPVSDSIRVEGDNANVSITDSWITDGDVGLNVTGAAANAQVAITQSTIHGSNSGVILDVASGVVDVSYSIISTWDVAGFDNSGSGTAGDSNNVYVDSDGLANARINVTPGANTTDNNSASWVFCSLTPGTANYLHINQSGPAYDIDGLGNNAGAFPSSCNITVSGVGNWDGYR